MNTPAPTPPDKRPAAPAASSNINYKEIIIRTVIVVLVLSSLVSVWWSMQRLKPKQKQVAELNATVNRLSAEVDAMEMRWSRQEVEELLKRYRQVNNYLFVGQPSLEGWLVNLKEQVIPMALDVRADFGQPAAGGSETNKTTVIPTTVSVDVKPASGIDAIRTPYERVLRLSQRLTAQEKRADLVELKVSGGGNSISRAVVVLNLWAGEEAAQ